MREGTNQPVCGGQNINLVGAPLEGVRRRTLGLAWVWALLLPHSEQLAVRVAKASVLCNPNSLASCFSRYPSASNSPKYV